MITREKPPGNGTAKKAAPSPKHPAEDQATTHFPIAGIGSSAGDLEALESFPTAMSDDSGTKVCQVADNMTIEPNTAYTIPPNKEMASLQLLEMRQPRCLNLPINTFFRPLAMPSVSSFPAPARTARRTATGHDFSLSPKNTIHQRLKRRMHVHQIDTGAGYVRYIQKNEHKGTILFKLIGVTSFFRDRAGFETLQNTCLPALLRKKPNDSQIQFWVPDSVGINQGKSFPCCCLFRC